mmetsp:Transcript_42944/g.105468  ORF Transcript_42944/g.105468 Transcript_42944/m.105468 type:complete len:620 (-) Transcript_42944:1634-3493(-)
MKLKELQQLLDERSNGGTFVRIPRQILAQKEKSTAPWLNTMDVAISHRYNDEWMELPLDIIGEVANANVTGKPEESREEVAEWTVWADPMGYPKEFSRGQGLLPYFNARKVVTVYPSWHVFSSRDAEYEQISVDNWNFALLAERLVNPECLGEVLAGAITRLGGLLLPKETFGGVYLLTEENWRAITHTVLDAPRWSNLASYDRMWMTAERTACAVSGKTYYPVKASLPALRADVARLLAVAAAIEVEEELATHYLGQFQKECNFAVASLLTKWFPGDDSAFTDLLTPIAAPKAAAVASRILRRNLLLRSAAEFTIDSVYIELYLAAALLYGCEYVSNSVATNTGPYREDSEHFPEGVLSGHTPEMKMWGQIAYLLASTRPSALLEVEERHGVPEGYERGQAPTCNLGVLGIMPLCATIVKTLEKQGIWTKGAHAKIEERNRKSVQVRNLFRCRAKFSSGLDTHLLECDGWQRFVKLYWELREEDEAETAPCGGTVSDYERPSIVLIVSPRLDGRIWHVDGVVRSLTAAVSILQKGTSGQFYLLEEKDTYTSDVRRYAVNMLRKTEDRAVENLKAARWLGVEDNNGVAAVTCLALSRRSGPIRTAHKTSGVCFGHTQWY